MKATLEFNLPEDREHHITAVQSVDFKSAIQEYDNYLRGLLKHAELSDDAYKAYDDARTKLHEYLNDENINLWS